MRSLRGLSLSLSFALTTALPGIYTLEGPPPGPHPVPWAHTFTTIDQTWIYTCPAAPTVFVSVTETQYVPVTETATTTATLLQTSTTVDIEVVTTTNLATLTEVDMETTTATAIELETTTDIEIQTTTDIEIQTTTDIVPTTITTPVTIFQTIISTTILTTTQTETVTSTTVTTTPVTDTVTTPTTATATEIVSLYEITTKATSITVCPTRLVNPTFTALGPYPTDWTWGCPPNWLCRPDQVDCNFEAGLPDENFHCSPNECIPAEAVAFSLPTWDVDYTGNSTPATNSGLNVQAIDHFFNMNPTDFGLTYEIFVVDEVLTLTTTYLEPPSPTVAARQAQTSIPGACYPWCNNCLLEAQSNGKTSKLCVPGSAFEVSLGQCEDCITYHKADDVGTFVQIAPQFQQFLDYCDQYTTVVVSTSVTATMTASSSTYSTMIPTVSTTVTPKVSAPPPSSPVQQTSVSTIVVSTLTESPSPSVTTETILTTTYSHTTISGPAWSQITIIMPMGNTTTTLYGSTLTSEGASLVLPTSPVVSTYVTTITAGATGQQVSAISQGSSAGPQVSSISQGSSIIATGTDSAPTSTFTGAAPALKQSSMSLCIAIGLAVLLAA